WRAGRSRIRFVWRHGHTSCNIHALMPTSPPRSNSMTYAATGDSVRIYEQVPQLARIRKDVLLGDVWKQPELAFRDRILVTLGVLAAGGKVEEMKSWMARGVEAGITLNE